jgi:hypothetical protein
LRLPFAYLSKPSLALNSSDRESRYNRRKYYR